MHHTLSTAKSFWNVTLREWHRLISRPIYFYCMIFMPVICLFLFTELMKVGLPDKLPVAVVDMDNSASSRNVIRTLSSMQQIRVYDVFPAISEARDAAQRGKVYGYLVIPKNFSHDVQGFRQPKLNYYTSYVYLIPGSLLYSNMRKLTELVSGSATRSQLWAKGKSDEQIQAYLQPIVIESHALNNPALNYSIYISNILIPGALMLLISMMCVYSIGNEIKEGTTKEWFELGNHSLLISLLGKLMPYTLIFFVMGALVDVYLYGALQFPCNCSMWAVLALTLCMVLSAQALGIIFLASVPTLRMGLSLSCLWGVLSFSISGMSFPYAAMSPMVKGLSYLFPLRYYYLTYLHQVLNGDSFRYCMYGYIGLIAFVLLAITLLTRLKSKLIHTEYIP